MDNNYDRMELLRKALFFRGKNTDWLLDQLGISVLDLHADFMGGHVPVYIPKIAELLDVPEAYFWNGFRIVDGQLVANEE